MMVSHRTQTVDANVVNHRGANCQEKSAKFFRNFPLSNRPGGSPRRGHAMVTLVSSKGPCPIPRALGRCERFDAGPGSATLEEAT
jgi:hypothetical protein